MVSSKQRAYVYLQLPQSFEVVTAGFYELAFPQGLATGSFEQPGLPEATGCGTAGAVRTAAVAASISDADQNVTASTARYRSGEASIIEVTDAQNLLIALRQSLYQAIYDYQTAKLRVARAVGQ